MPTTNIDDQHFWDSVEKIVKTVEAWPDWKKEGRAVLDKCDLENLVPNLNEVKSSKTSSKKSEVNFE